LLGLSALALGRQARLAVARPVVVRPDARLVVVLLRGALDGLAVVQDYGDADCAGLRGPLALPHPAREGGVLDLRGLFGLHPSLPHMHGMFGRNEALVLHATAGPYRTRSHFDAQDLLESGAADQRLSSGWLNRALEALPDWPEGDARTGLAVGWTCRYCCAARCPSACTPRRAAGGRTPTSTRASRTSRMTARCWARPSWKASEPVDSRPTGSTTGCAAAAASLPCAASPGGCWPTPPAQARVAALETGGWDTHAAQMSRLNTPLRQLDEGLEALRGQLGGAWRQTAILVMTEFGRTVRVNGNLGTDHGTGGAAFLLGGAVAGGRVVADWPGFGAGRLFENRDLQPTLELREVAEGLLRDHLKLPPHALEAAFPSSSQVMPKGGLLAA
jgi:uncharacterized protein (DUF1501 family)